MWFNKDSKEIIKELYSNLINGLSSVRSKIKIREIMVKINFKEKRKNHYYNFSLLKLMM